MNEKRIRLSTFLDVMFKIVVGLGVLWGVFVISGYLFAAKPFELYIQPQTIRTYTLCPGQSFEYTSGVIVRKTPITLVRTDTWFSATQHMTILPDSYTNMEIFNWDKSVTKIVPKAIKVTVPTKTNRGEPLAPGEYRYIVNLNAWGDSFPASISFTVHVPANCPS